MANQQYLKILKQGVEIWNKWRSEHSDLQLDFSQANLRKTDLNYADLHNIDLSGADLRESLIRETNLVGANLNMANLKKAELTKADLRFANLYNADLSGATFYGADLSEADLREAELYGADFSTAILIRTILSEAKLMGACLRDANLTGADLSGADLTKADLRGADLTEVKLTQQPTLHGTSMFIDQREQLRKSGATALEEIEIESTASLSSSTMMEYAPNADNYQVSEKRGGYFTLMKAQDTKRTPRISSIKEMSAEVQVRALPMLLDPSVTGRALLELARIGEEEFAEDHIAGEQPEEVIDYNSIWEEWEG